MAEELSATETRRRKAVRTAAILGAVVLGYYIFFLASHIQ